MKRVENNRARKETVVSAAIAMLVGRYQVALDQVCVLDVRSRAVSVHACQLAMSRVLSESRALGQPLEL